MARVSDAMKKHQAEEAARAKQLKSARPDQASVPGDGRASKPPEEPSVVSVSANGYSAALVAHHDRGGGIAEQYRALRTNVLAQHEDERLCTLITSFKKGEGKTITCLNLGLVLAEDQECRTVVVDCDLRKGRMAKALNTKQSPGMADLLRGAATLEDVVQLTAYPNLFLVPAGRAEIEDVGELMTKPELSETINRLRKEYDHVLLDSPPVEKISDAGVLGRAVGEALLVVRLKKTHREDVDKAIRLLRAANIRVGGVVLTHQKGYFPNYLYRYS